MIPELSVLEKMEEIKTILNDTVIHPYHNSDYAIKNIKKKNTSICVYGKKTKSFITDYGDKM